MLRLPVLELLAQLLEDAEGEPGACGLQVQRGKGCLAELLDVPTQAFDRALSDYISFIALRAVERSTFNSSPH